MRPSRSILAIFSAAHLILLALGEDTYAQSPAQRADEFFQAHKRAVVKIHVVGHDPKGGRVSEEGSGFFIISSPQRSFILTARHLLGSNEAEQGKNSDWKVDNGVLDRTIQISVLDQQSNLIDIKGAVHIYPTPSDIDIAVLEIDQGTYPTLALGDPLSSAAGVHDVALVGFLKGKNQPESPTVTAGHVEGLNYVTKLPSDEGQSGGSWIDLESGKVFAVASGVDYTSHSPSYTATIVTLMRPIVTSLLPMAGQFSVEPQNKPATAPADNSKTISTDSSKNKNDNPPEFNGLDVIYFKRPNDGSIVIDIFDREKIQWRPQKAKSPIGRMLSLVDHLVGLKRRSF